MNISKKINDNYKIKIETKLWIYTDIKNISTIDFLLSIIFIKNTGHYHKINCITLLDIFRNDNNCSVKSIYNNIHNISKYLLYIK